LALLLKYTASGKSNQLPPTAHNVKLNSNKALNKDDCILFLIHCEDAEDAFSGIRFNRLLGEILAS
jgi:hypothetical protein